MSGAVTGDTLQANVKSQETLCDLTVTREKS